MVKYRMFEQKLHEQGLKPVSLENTGCKRLLKFKNRSVKVIV